MSHKHKARWIRRRAHLAQWIKVSREHGTEWVMWDCNIINVIPVSRASDDMLDVIVSSDAKRAAARVNAKKK